MENDTAIAEGSNELPGTTAESKPAHQRHAHGPNFGRFVAGCPACEANPNKYQRKAKAKSEVVPTPEPQAETITVNQSAAAPPVITLTPEQLQALLATMGQPTGGASLVEALKEFARELNAPDPREAEEKEKERLRVEEAKRRAIKVAQMEIQAREQMQAACLHQKENGRTAIVRGQVYNDGFFHPFCQHCGKRYEPIRATIADMTTA